MNDTLRGVPQKTFLWTRKHITRAKFRQVAKQAIRNVERHHRATVQKMRRRAIEDATERLGGRQHAIELLMCAAIAGRYKDGWIPPTYYHEHVRPRVNGTLHHMAHHAVYNQLFLTSSVFPDIIYVVNGRFLRPDRTVMTSELAIELLRDAGNEVVFKRDGSGFGLGVRMVSTSALRDLKTFPNGVFQHRIISDPSLTFGMSALPTLRIGTILPVSGPPQIRMAYLKVGRQMQAHVLAQNQVRLAVDCLTGEVDGIGFSPSWEQFERHPDSGYSFKGLAVPNYDAAARTVLALHSESPFARFICWDLAICAEGRVHVLEWEGGVPSFGEPVQGPCFRGLSWDCLHQSEIE